jgi:hypothetical protein
MTAQRLSTPAWLLEGIVASRRGTLELAGGQLRFVSDGRPVFAAPLSEVGEVAFPWYYLGGGMTLRIGGVRHRLSFVEAGDSGDIREGRRVGRAWKRALAGGERPEE